VTGVTVCETLLDNDEDGERAAIPEFEGNNPRNEAAPLRRSREPRSTRPAEQRRAIGEQSAEENCCASRVHRVSRPAVLLLARPAMLQHAIVDKLTLARI
jgi:hypothetical protein